ncbi:MAG: hypothetical protein CMF38_07715 [Legionellaceae bacterium]|nr:hypothetical protein [Legionellaceae bacterium]MBJ16500.1 hypothetical protein [Legionellaceae bacterium]HCA89897.1 hypothetical protein [Legionellales bacterium]|tara:strand:- start:661 stop:3183 length:2523 start_codon:yes stop_codon:yes gene_type:complete
MVLPIKALQLQQLQFLTDEMLPSSGHQVVKCALKHTDGTTAFGFYKPLDDTYPQILAQYSVFTSVLAHISIPGCMPQECLVFDGDCIKGTFSYEVSNLKTMLGGWLCMWPEDATEREALSPGVETLIADNIAELLVERWFDEDDDMHPGNIGIDDTGRRIIFDNDMTHYSKTYLFKGARLVDGVAHKLPEKTSHLTRLHLSNFPNIAGRTYWPTNYCPTTINMAKSYKNYEAFRALAGVTRFHEQMFDAILAKLILLDSKVVRQHLFEHFGTLLLDISDLSAVKQQNVEHAHPHLFNHTTYKQPLVMHFMEVFRQKYQELYQVSVYYKGCQKNDVGAFVPDFCQYLTKRPQTAARIIDAGSGDRQRYQQRYHQIWRDAHLPELKAILYQIQSWVKKEIHAANSWSVSQCLALPTHPDSLMDAWQFVEDNSTDFNEERIITRIDEATCMGYLYEQVLQATQIYYDINEFALTWADNQTFIHSIEQHIADFEQELSRYDMVSNIIDKGLGKLANFLKAIQLTDNLAQKPNHLPLTPSVYRTTSVYQHTHQEVIDAALILLFNWVEKMTTLDFNAHILAVIIDLYEPLSLSLSNKARSEPVQIYLKLSQETNLDKLGFILSTGGTKANSLNTLLVRYLMQKLLEDESNLYTLSLISVATAFEKGEFNAVCYAEHAVNLAKTHPGFNHIRSHTHLTQVNQCLYRWVQTMMPETFRHNIIDEALRQYEPSVLSYLWSTKHRGQYIKAFIKDNPKACNTEILARIFSEGGIESTSLTTYVFQRLISHMQLHIAQQKLYEKNSAYQLVMQINLADNAHIQGYLQSLKEFAPAFIPAEESTFLKIDAS